MIVEQTQKSDKLKFLFWTILVGFLLGMNGSQTLKDSSEFFMVVLAFFMFSRVKDWPRFDRKLVVTLGLWVLGGVISYFVFAPIHVPIEETELLNFRWIFFFFAFGILAKFYLDWNRLLRVVGLVFGFCFTLDLILYFKAGGRAGGIFNNPINFANLVAPFVLISWSYLLNAISRKLFSIWTWLHALCVVAGCSLVLATQTRGVIIALFAVLVLLSLFYGFKTFLVTTLCAILAVVSVLALSRDFNERMVGAFNSENTDYSRATRLSFWRANLEIWKEHPIFGVGYGVNNHIFYNYLTPDAKTMLEKQPELKTTHAHNQYIQILVGGGLWGIACFLFLVWLLGKYLFEVYRAVSKNSDYFPWVLGLGAGLFCFLIAGLTEANYTVTKNRYIFVILATLIVNLRQTVLSSKENKS